VLEVADLGIKALAYSSETVTQARKTGTKLHLDIAECKWNLVCVDPEHLTAKDWRLIKDSAIFRDNLSLLCVDEIHLINQWGVEFRQAFEHIGRFARGCLPASTSIVGLSATLQPGPDTLSVCTSMGFIAGNFIHVRRSNERPNIQFILAKLTHGLGGDEFPDLLPYVTSNRKTVIYCSTIDMCWRVAVYLWRLLPPCSDKTARVRLYHALCWSEENEETTRLLREDPRTQIVIATIAFGQGINVKTLVDSIQLGFPVSLDQEEQQRGRVGRDLTTPARGIILVQPSSIVAAEKYLKCKLPAGF
jgi:superfamily II DNA helicase RecQ